MTSVSIRLTHLIPTAVAIMLLTAFAAPVQAGGPCVTANGPCASEVSQASTLAESALSAAKNTISSVSDLAREALAYEDFTKEFVLDGIAWNIAKQVLSNMTSSIVNWINSGFEGSPAFVQDLEGFLLSAADQAVGEFINTNEYLGFVCEPFSLDIRIALTLNYNATRDDVVPACTLTGIADNVENFLAGTWGDNGLANWFEIVAQPQNTPYGAYLAAEVEMNDVILKTRDGEKTLLEFGDGFFSTSICETVHGGGTTRENCFLSTPGKVIQEQLTFTLSSGERSLIEADEIDEIINALMGQLAQQAVTGVNGLLGLSGDTGYTDYSYGGGVTTAFADGVSEDSETGNSLEVAINNAIDNENDYQRVQRGFIRGYDNLVERNEAIRPRSCQVADSEFDRVRTFRDAALRELDPDINGTSADVEERYNRFLDNLDGANTTRVQTISDNFNNQRRTNGHGTREIAEAEIDLEDFREGPLTTLRNKIRDAEAACP